MVSPQVVSTLLYVCFNKLFCFGWNLDLTVHKTAYGWEQTNKNIHLIQ